MKIPTKQTLLPPTVITQRQETSHLPQYSNGQFSDSNLYSQKIVPSTDLSPLSEALDTRKDSYDIVVRIRKKVEDTIGVRILKEKYIKQLLHL